MATVQSHSPIQGLNQSELHAVANITNAVAHELCTHIHRVQCEATTSPDNPVVSVEAILRLQTLLVLVERWAGKCARDLLN